MRQSRADLASAPNLTHTRVARAAQQGVGLQPANLSLVAPSERPLLQQVPPPGFIIGTWMCLGTWMNTQCKQVLRACA